MFNVKTIRHIGLVSQMTKSLRGHCTLQIREESECGIRTAADPGRLPQSSGRRSEMRRNDIHPIYKHKHNISHCIFFQKNKNKPKNINFGLLGFLKNLSGKNMTFLLLTFKTRGFSKPFSSPEALTVTHYQQHIQLTENSGQ